MEWLQLCLAISVSEHSYEFAKRVAYLIWTEPQVMEDERRESQTGFSVLTLITKEFSSFFPGRNKVNCPLWDNLLSISIHSRIKCDLDIITSMQINSKVATIALRHLQVCEYASFPLKTAATPPYRIYSSSVEMSAQQRPAFRNKSPSSDSCF